MGPMMHSRNSVKGTHSKEPCNIEEMLILFFLMTWEKNSRCEERKDPFVNLNVCLNVSLRDTKQNSEGFKYWTAWPCLTVEETAAEVSLPFTEAFSNQRTPFTTVWRVEQDGIKMTPGWLWSGTGVELGTGEKYKCIHEDSHSLMDFWSGTMASVFFFFCFILNSIHLNAIIRIIAVALLICIFWPRVSTLSDAPSSHRSGKAGLSLVWSWTSAHFSSRTRALVSLQYSGFFLRFHHCLPVSPNTFIFCHYYWFVLLQLII